VNILGRGVYSLAEAAKLAELRPARVRDWFRSSGPEGPHRAVFQSDYPSMGDDEAISFLDLIEVYITGRLREAKPPVSLQHIRSVHSKLSRDTGQSHPFCTRDIYHKKGKVFTQSLEDQAMGRIIQPLTSQSYNEHIIMPFLEKIEYDHLTNLARLWRIADGVVIDPSRCYGKPIVDAVSISTRILAGAYEANGRDSLRVADWYGVDQVHVENAVNFERRRVAA